MKIDNIRYRKANAKDLDEIAGIITKLLGTCNIDIYNSTIQNNNQIIVRNKEELKKDIKNYYVCEYDNQIIGACGISNIIDEPKYNLTHYREILYLVVDSKYQRCGIGTELMQLVWNNKKETIIYEAWGDKEYVNSKFLLKKLGFKLFRDLGDTYYKDSGYCPFCINRYKNCNSCKAEIWIKVNK